MLAQQALTQMPVSSVSEDGTWPRSAVAGPMRFRCATLLLLVTPLCCAVLLLVTWLSCAVLCCAVVLFHLSSGHTAGMPSTHSTSYTLGRKQQQQHLCSTGRHVHHIWSQQACSKVVLRRAVSRSASCSVHDCCNAATFIKQSLRFPPICEAVTACLFCR